MIGAALLLPNKTTRQGAWVMLPTFAFATIVLLANGMLAFGASSLLFIAMAALHGLRWPQAAQAAPA